MGLEAFIKELNPFQQGLLRLVLEGVSPIDTPPSPFTDEAHVRRFLKLNQYDLDRPKDQVRLQEIHNEACGYLEGSLQIKLPQEILQPASLTSLFLLASRGEPTVARKACALLKTMSIIHHIDGREMLYSCPISFRSLFNKVEDAVEREFARMNSKGLRLVRFEGGRKSKESLVTKLLSQKKAVASQINERVRYRLVTKTQEEILQVLLYLFSELIPFNALLSSQTTNQIFPQGLLSGQKIQTKGETDKDYSGRDYRVIKFTVDLPIRLDPSVASLTGPLSDALGSIVFCLVEFQITDEATEIANDEGENRYDLYKSRQKAGVRERLDR